MAGDREKQQRMTREEAAALIAYLGRAAAVVSTTMIEARLMQLVYDALAGVTLGALSCTFAPPTVTSAEDPPPQPSPARGRGEQAAPARDPRHRGPTPAKLRRQN
jgi:hypothetical protein